MDTQRGLQMKKIGYDKAKKILSIIGTILLILIFYISFTQLCIHRALRKKILTPCNVSETATFEEFFIAYLTPFAFSTMTFTGFLDDIEIDPEDSTLFKNHLGLYYGEKVFIEENEGIRYILIIAYGEARLYRLLDKAGDFLFTGYAKKKYSNYYASVSDPNVN
jgi:hypothetical protein